MKSHLVFTELSSLPPPGCRLPSHQRDLHLLSPLHLPAWMLLGGWRSGTDRSNGAGAGLWVFGRLRGTLDWTLKRAFVRRWWRPVMSVVIGGWSADGRGCSAAGTRQRRRHSGRLEGAAVEGSGLEGTARGSFTLGQRGGRSLCATISLPISVLTGTSEILHQNRREDTNDAVKLSLPETVILVGFPAQDADDGAFWK